MGRMTLMVHTASDAASFSAPVREIVRQIDASVPLTTLRTMADYHDRRTVGVMRLLVRTVTALGAVGLLLALIGLYGTMSYAVSRRTREIGIRMAIGAAPASIRQLLLKQGAWIAGPGIAVGLAVGYFAASIFEQGFLGMAVAHPAVFVAVPSLLCLAALAACWLPARRAAATPPTQALRCD
jgi:ABC-type antimicrobial peptide transport system permease subunit